MADIGMAFRALHHGESAFIIPNPWDIGSARILAGMGFTALATTSWGMAFSAGYPEGAVPKEAMLQHCRDVVAATPLPVSADLEKGFGDSPESAAETVRAAAETGLAGCSIEDHTGSKNTPIYDKSLAVERVAAAVKAARSLERDFVLTARCENLLWDRPGMDDIIDRFHAYEAAGADVLYAPGIRDLADVRRVCEALSCPVNAIVGEGAMFSVAELSEVGVKRISVGSGLSRLVYGSLIAAAEEMQRDGTFNFAKDAAGFDALEQYFPSNS